MPTTPPSKKCFVIMPFGEKKDADGKVIDFDKVYKYLIKKPIESIGHTCIRCDEISETGWIHSKMFEHIYNSDIAIVDITSLNPNVFYELGIRHALVDSVTVLIRREGTNIPFNIQGFKVIDYNHEDMESVEKAQKEIVDLIQNGLKLKKKDSPVYEVLDLKILTTAKEITNTAKFEYQLRDSEKQIGLITGDIQNVKGIDVWVNSENTHMQMARFIDRSISSTIRFCGAKKNAAKKVIEDTIAKELLEKVGEDANVPAGEVVVTGAGELERSNGVKKIFHAASVIGEPCRGFRPINDVGRCVRNALKKVDEDELKDVELKSILFPLIGTGTGRGELEPKARILIENAISHLVSHADTKFQKVYFLAWSEKDLEVCQRILHGAPEVVIA
jgi:O-acetyl-ADP-ribose deacetylase (regulator of RNase III)